MAKGGPALGRRRAGGRIRTYGTVAICSVLSAAASASASQTTITTVAGGGTRTDDGVAAVDAALAAPVGVRAYANGFVVAEQSRHRIRRVAILDPLDLNTGPISTLAGTGAFGGGIPVAGATPSQVALELPCCVSVTSGGALLIADTLGGMVHRLSAGKLDTVAGMGAPSSCPPTPPSGIAATAAQLCFVVGVGAAPSESRFLIAEDGLADQDRVGGARVYEVDPAGTLRVVAGGGCPNPPSSPPPLLVCLANPRGPVFTGNGTEFLVADRGRNAVWRVSSTNPAAATAQQIGPPGLAAPTDLSMAIGGGYLIADRGSCRVLRVAGLEPGGAVTVLAGTSCDPGAPAGDGGPAGAAGLYSPQGVAATPGGVLISDTARGVVRHVERTTITHGPASLTREPSADLAFASSEPAPAFRCALDGAEARACDSPLLLRDLDDGPHEFAVLDAQTPADPSPARRRWVVDTTPPSALEALSPAVGASGLPPRPRFRWTPAQDATAGIDHYEVLVDGEVVATSGGCGEECGSFPAHDLSEAAHVWGVRAVDRAGNVRETGDQPMAVGSDPVAGFVAAPNPALAESPVTLDASASSDAGGPIARYSWDLDGDGVFETDAGGEATIVTTFPLAGAVEVGLRVTDVVGRIGEFRQLVRITAPLRQPRDYGVTINGGAGWTNEQVVTLGLVFPESATSVLVSNDGGFLAARTFLPEASLRWRLASTGGRLPKTVYVRFAAGPFVSETFTDDIVLDSVPPVVTGARLTADISSPTGGARVSATGWRLLTIRARDRQSGLAAMQVAADRRRPGRLVRFRSTCRVAGSARWVRVRDRAGNWSRWRHVR